MTDERDVVLGEALRHALDAGGHEWFVARVRARLGEVRASFWEPLAAWAWRGVPIAAALALVVGFLAAHVRRPRPSLDDVFTAVAADPEPLPLALISATRPDPSAAFATLFDR